MEKPVSPPPVVETSQEGRDNFFKRIVDGLLGRNKQAVDARRVYALGGKNPAENANQEAVVTPSETQKSAVVPENNSITKSSSSIDQRGIGY